MIRRDTLNEILKHSTFARNVLTLMSGTTFAQFLLVVVSPFLTRLYSPDDFGLLTIYTSILNILLIAVSWRYELAIVLPEKDEDAAKLVLVSIIICTLMCVFVLFVSYLFREYLSIRFKIPALRYWLLFLPASLFFNGLYNILNYWSIRKHYFRRLALRQIIQSIITVIVQLAPLLFHKMGSVGLLGGVVVGQLCSTLLMASEIIKKDFLLYRQLDFRSLVNKFLQYRSFPLFQIAAAILNSLSLMAPTLMLGLYFSSEIVGYYALGNKIVAAPLSIISNSISNVFFSKLEQSKREGKISVFVFSTYRKLLIIGLFPILIIALIGPSLIGRVFGEQWIPSGVILRVLCPFLIANFLTAPLSTVFLVYDKHRDYLIFNIVLLVLSVFSFSIGNSYCNYMLALALYSFIAAVIYFCFGMRIFSLSMVDGKDIFKFTGKVILRSGLFLCPVIIARLSNCNDVLVVLISMICLFGFYLYELYFKTKFSAREKCNEK